MNSSLWFFPIAALTNAVTSGVLAILLLLSSRKIRATKYLIYLCLATVAWSFPYFLWQISSSAESALFWSKILMYGAIFTSIGYLHLVIVFLELDKIKFYRIVLAIFYLFSLLWIIVNTTSYFVVGVYSISYFKFWPVAGPFYLPYLVAFVSQFLYASFLLFREYRHAVGARRMQVILLLSGLLIAFIGGSTNYPLWFGVDIAPWGNAVVSIYVVMTVYAIMKYKFLNIKVISAELFTGLLFIILLLNTFLSATSLEFVLRFSAVVVASVFGVMLIRSVKKEVTRSEEMANMAHSLEKANLRLQELDRQKTEFLSIASHQLRTPLSILKGYLELIEDGAYGRITRQTKEVLDKLNLNNEQLIQLVDEFLDISRIEQGRTKYKFTDLDMNKTIAQVIEGVENKADIRKIKIVWKKDNNLKTILADEEKVSNVLMNYLDNAIKYSEKGNIVIETKVEKGGLSVFVRDRGLGFDKVDKANFFQKFYRGKNVDGIDVTGTGLGLYVCRRFIEAHKGVVWAHSKGLGKGSEFGFWIPYIKK